MFSEATESTSIPLEGSSAKQSESHTKDWQEQLNKLREVQQRLTTIVRGKESVIERLLVAMLAGGSVLLEDVPGVGKTTLAKAIASLIELRFSRVQCTPDLLPADILGGSVFHAHSGEFEFRPGPIFCDLLIADEVNRASPRTQSALLEAMAEMQVTIDGTVHRLERPFIVIATQNPIGFEGTFPLPESQLDRFLFKLSLEYPDTESEVAMLLDDEAPLDATNDMVLQPIMHRDDLVKLQSMVDKVQVSEKVARYIAELVRCTREDARVQIGCSPRGAKLILRSARAIAMFRDRDFVLPDDIQSVFSDCVGHRLTLSPSHRGTPEDLLAREWIGSVDVPV
ncbi:MAG: MoxR family ATPase [Planctomycetota bacterium]